MSRKIKFAKRLTFTYFSIVSFAIILIHYSVYHSTFEGVERSIAQKRFEQAVYYAEKILTGNETEGTDISQEITVYVGKENLPEDLILPRFLKDDIPTEVYPGGRHEDEYFVVRTYMTFGDDVKDVWFIDHEDIPGVGRNDFLLDQKFQLLLSLGLLLLSLLLVQRISGLLTDPLSYLAKELSRRSMNDLSPVSVPEGLITQEVESLINSINHYQDRLSQLIERERSFNNYASHELRTPLMVIKSATFVLKEYQDDPFVQKQCKRILGSSDEMNDFITTLLSLTRSDDFNGVDSTILTREEIEDCIRSNEFLLEEKNADWQLTMDDSVTLKIPPTSLRIMLSNLVKNAFLYSNEETIQITLTEHEMSVRDNGKGIDENAQSTPHGHGLGLVIVTDICRKHDLKFSLTNNDDKGCTAKVAFSNV